jgi:hypothetical protein
MRYTGNINRRDAVYQKVLFAETVEFQWRNHHYFLKNSWAIARKLLKIYNNFIFLAKIGLHSKKICIFAPIIYRIYKKKHNV